MFWERERERDWQRMGEILGWSTVVEDWSNAGAAANLLHLEEVDDDDEDP